MSWNLNVTWSTDLKEQIEGFLLILGKVDAKPLDVNAILILSDGHLRQTLDAVWQGGQEIKHGLIVDLQIADAHCDSLLRTVFNLFIHLSLMLDKQNLHFN